jgi:hypothetical protein
MRFSSQPFTGCERMPYSEPFKTILRNPARLGSSPG